MSSSYNSPENQDNHGIMYFTQTWSTISGMGGRRRKKRGKTKSRGPTMVHMPPRYRAMSLSQPNSAKTPRGGDVHNGRDYLFIALTLVTEYLAVSYGSQWLAWAAAVFAWLAIHSYAKQFIANRLVRFLVSSLGAVVLLLVTLYAVKGAAGRLAPDFQWEWYKLGAAKGDGVTMTYASKAPDDVVLMIEGKLTNNGGQSVTSHWGAKLMLEGDTVTKLGDLIVPSRGDEKKNLRMRWPGQAGFARLPFSEGYLPEVTATNPIGTGASKAGFVLFAFHHLPYTKGETFRHGKVVLTFDDTIGKQYIFDYTLPEPDSEIGIAPTELIPGMPRPSNEQTEQHTHTEYGPPEQLKRNLLLPFHEGQIPEINLHVFNSGQFPVKEPLQGGKIVLVPAKETSEAFEKFGNSLDWLEHAGGVLNPNIPKTFYHTWKGPRLTRTNVTNLNAGTEALCALGSVKWTDDSGRYQTNFSQCFVAEGDGTFNWHVTAEDAQEHKLP